MRFTIHTNPTPKVETEPKWGDDNDEWESGADSKAAASQV
jgi:hypothetical protein